MDRDRAASLVGGVGFSMLITGLVGWFSIAGANDPTLGAIKPWAWVVALLGISLILVAFRLKQPKDSPDAKPASGKKKGGRKR